MNKKTIYWLHNQLPEWQKKGWITSDIADEIKLYYDFVSEYSGPSLSRLILIVFGSLLVALGIFLLFAGYWYSFSPNGRFDLAVGLLLISLIVVFLVLWRTPRGSAFAEGATVFYMLALMSSSFLVGDTFYLGDSFGSFLLLSLALSLPLIYLLGSSVGLFIYLIGSMLWSISPHAVNFFIGPWAIWILLLASVPFYVDKVRENKNRFNSLTLLSWAYIASIFGAFFFTVDDFLGPALNVFFMACLASSIYGFGVLCKHKAIWAFPFRTIGVAGLLYVIVVGTFVSTWNIEELAKINFVIIVLAIIFLILPILMAIKLLRKKWIISSLISASPLVLLVCYVMALGGTGSLVVTLLFNAFILVITILLFFKGSMDRKVSLVNGGLLALFALVSARFIDPGFTFVERGSAFLGAGISILVSNGFYMWRKSHKQHQVNREVERIRRQHELEAREADRQNARLTKEKAKGDTLFQMDNVEPLEVTIFTPAESNVSQDNKNSNSDIDFVDLANSEGAKLVRQNLHRGGSKHE